jgi:Holliday junction resolvase-like predicted endonuclease
MNLEEIKMQLSRGKAVEEVLEKFDWKEFEEAVAEIFRENEFFVRKNFRFKTGRRYEIDLIAVRGSTVVCADCKQWCKGRYKKSGIKQAALEQEKRVEEFKRFVEKNLIVRKTLKLEEKVSFYSFVITLFEEEVAKEDKTFVVPVWKLNNFLLALEEYL